VIIGRTASCIPPGQGFMKSIFPGFWIIATILQNALKDAGSLKRSFPVAIRLPCDSHADLLKPEPVVLRKCVDGIVTDEGPLYLRDSPSILQWLAWCDCAAPQNGQHVDLPERSLGPVRSQALRDSPTPPWSQARRIFQTHGLLAVAIALTCTWMPEQLYPEQLHNHIYHPAAHFSAPISLVYWTTRSFIFLLERNFSLGTLRIYLRLRVAKA